MTEIKVAVIDNGSAMCKVGIAGQDAPTTVFPTVVGQPCQESQISDLHTNYIGLNAQKHKDMLSLSHPIESGIITNWSAMEKLWQYAFHDLLKLDPKESAVLMTDSPNNSNANKENIAQVMIETFNVPAVYIAKSPVLTLYASGHKSGIVLESGDGISHAVPINDGYAISHSMLYFDVAGKDLTEYMLQVLKNKGYLAAGHDTARDLKERYCYVALDYENELQAAAKNESLEKNYELPDGQVITIGCERFQCPEALFKPTAHEINSNGIHQLVYDSIAKCNDELQQVMYSNVVLGGGSTMFAGFAERFDKELKALAPSSTKTKVIAPPERMCSSWIGGSILGSLSAFQDIWISKQEYEEAGSAIVCKKCF